jgi:hypothetical protein
VLVLGWHGGIRREWHDMAPGWSTHDGAAGGSGRACFGRDTRFGGVPSRFT